MPLSLNDILARKLSVNIQVNGIFFESYEDYETEPSYNPHTFAAGSLVEKAFFPPFLEKSGEFFLSLENSLV